jgi:hypothetical protein
MELPTIALGFLRYVGHVAVTGEAPFSHPTLLGPLFILWGTRDRYRWAADPESAGAVR